MMASLATTPIGEEEYLRLERLADTKCEFHDGQVFAISGGSPTHAFLCHRMGSLLDRKAPYGCRVYSSDLRIKIAKSKTYT
jgi:hypothetical protein